MRSSSRRRLLGAVLAGSAALALGACASRKQPEARRTTGEYTSDAALTAKVKSAIASDVDARTAAAINIETYRGVVELSGFVGSRAQADQAAAAAKKVEGVRSVKSDVRVKSSS